MALGLLDYWNGFWIYVGWWLVPILLLFWYRKALGKYPIDVVIYEKRGNDVIKTNDVAGRFNEPVNCYRLKGAKDSIPIPQYDWVLQCMYKPTNLFEKISNFFVGKIGSITLFKYSSKQYKPINVHVNGQLVPKLKEIKDKNGNSIYINIYESINVKHSLSKLDFEVIDWDDINHMTQELRAIATRRAPTLKFLEKYGGWIAFILGVLIIIFAGYYYKELLLDAGSKFETMTLSGAGQKVNNTNSPAQVPDIPLIGDLQ